MLTNQEVNIPELRKEVEWVEEQATKSFSDPDREWYQRAWNLTKERKRMLVAWGKAYANTSERGPMSCQLYGEMLGSREEIIKTLQEVPEDCGTAFCVAGHLAQRHEKTESNWNDFGARILGISYSQASRLFSEENDAKDIRRIAEEIAGERL